MYNHQTTLAKRNADTCVPQVLHLPLALAACSFVACLGHLTIDHAGSFSTKTSSGIGRGVTQRERVVTPKTTRVRIENSQFLRYVLAIHVEATLGWKKASSLGRVGGGVWGGGRFRRVGTPVSCKRAHRLLAKPQTRVGVVRSQAFVIMWLGTRGVREKNLTRWPGVDAAGRFRRDCSEVLFINP